MQQIHLLLVEDNEGDILLTREALEEGKIFNELSVVKDGEQAIAFLEQKEPFQSAKKPDLILLDINLPKLNGHEVLSYIRQKDHLKKIPVIMLTTSSSEKDILKSYENYANCFITKPVETEDFLKVISDIENFWINITTLPNMK